jgi:DNA-binding NtrC family response regulator
MARILLVDDDQAVSSALARYLQMHGHLVANVSSARAALDLVNTETDVVITDLSMPGMGGAGLMQALRERAVDAPVILMSGRLPYPEESAGAAYVLHKPFGPDKLVAAIERVLGKGSDEESVTGS